MTMQHKNRNITTVSHHHSHRSIKKKRSNSIVHISIRIPRPTPSKNIHSHTISNNKNKLSINKNPFHENSKTCISKNSHSTKLTSLPRSFKVSHDQTATELLPDKNGMTNDYHKISKRNKKIKLSRRCFIGSLITSVILLLIVTAILLILFMKPKKKILSSVKIPVLRWDTSGITIAGNGTAGNNSNLLNNPRDIILDHANNLYVADSLNHRIQKFFSGSFIGTTLIGNGTVGLSQYQFNTPSRIILDSNENMYIADTFNHRIQFWQNNALSTSTVAGVTNTPGGANNRLWYPYGIVLNEMNNILYISDYLNHRIMSYTNGATNGALVFGGTGAGTANTKLNSPVGLQFDAISKSFIITNHAASNIVRYVLSTTNWTLLAGDINGTSGSTSMLFLGPTEAIFDPMGNLYVADRNNHRIQFFPAGQFNGSTIAGITGVNDSNATTLNWPWSVRLDSQLNLYVADGNNHRIRKFLRIQ